MSKRVVEKTALKLGVSKKEAEKIVKEVLSSIKESISEDGSLTLINFGSFSVKPFKRTSKLHGKTYNVDKNIVRFKAGAGLSKAVN